MKTRIRADQLLFEQGLAESREKAKSLIMAGRVILQGTASACPLKPGRLLASDTVLTIKPGRDFVSRGAYKLATILDALNLKVDGYVCLDAGASTGGFTDCLLQRGASRIYAIDVGKNQLHEKLRADSRVINMEGINLRTAAADLLPEKVDLITGDLSFISLTHILPVCNQWAKSGSQAAILIKPQFELGPEKVNKGVVRKESDHLLAVEKIVRFCEDTLGWKTRLTLPAKIKGPKGNQEYMALFEI